MQRTLRVLTALAIACTLSACNQDTEPAVSETPTVEHTTAAPEPSPSETVTETAPPTEEPSPEPSPSPTLSSEEQAAQDTVLEFFRIYEKLGQDPEYSLQDLAEITDGEVRGRLTELVTLFRNGGEYVEGSAKVHILSTELQEGEGGEQQVVVMSCRDNTGTTTMDVETNQPVVPDPKVPYTSWKLVTADRDGWKIVDGGNKEVESCP